MSTLGSITMPETGYQTGNTYKEKNFFKLPVEAESHNGQ